LADVLISNHAASTLLQATRITVRRGTERLFSELSFTIGSGQMVWLRGPNGSGKTSLLRTVAGLSRPDTGEIAWPVHSANDDDEDSPRKPRLVYLGHSNGLKDDLTAMESLQFLASLHGRNSSVQQVNAALGRLGIRHRGNLAVRTLSQGQRKRVALARLALESEPLLWVLDEPFDALDDAGIASVHALMSEHRARGGAVLLTSHIPVVLPGQSADVLTLDRVARA
jgi:heme exporter protein A